MEVLLLSDISGVGRKNDLVVVKNGFALNHLLPERKALVVTPNVRRRYAQHIKKRAEEREREKELLASLSNTLLGKTLHIAAKASKTGKLYAALSESQIVDALQSEYSINVPVSSVSMKNQIKIIGTHTVLIAVGTQQSKLSVEIQPLAETVKASA